MLLHTFRTYIVLPYDQLSLLWKLRPFNVTAVEIELAVLIEPALEIEPF